MNRKFIILTVALLFAGLATFLFLNQSRNSMPEEDRYAKIFPVLIGSFVATFSVIFLLTKRFREGQASHSEEIHRPKFLQHKSKSPMIVAVLAGLVLVALLGYFVMTRNGIPEEPGTTHLIGGIVVLTLIVFIGIAMILFRLFKERLNETGMYGKSARQILDERYARGEITDSEYRSKLEELNRR